MIALRLAGGIVKSVAAIFVLGVMNVVIMSPVLLVVRWIYR